MNILAHTKYGVFRTSQVEYDEERYMRISEFLEGLSELEYLQLQTDDGDVYLSKELIADSLFILQK
jgi:hypothetical protein